MRQPPVLENLAWRRVRAGRAASQAVPPLPGVYAFAAVLEHYGLPTSMEWMYIGKAKRLNQRLGQHDPVREANPGLSEWLVSHGRSAQLWYAVLDDGDLNAVEQELIRTIRPRFNRRLYGGLR
jgi:excinuclease UvrABC nuclease subunit